MNSTTGLAQSYSNSLPVCQYIFIFGILFCKNGSVFKEKSVSSVVDESDKWRISKKVFSNNNNDGIHEASRKIIKRSPTSQMEEEKTEEYKKSLIIIRKFQQEGLSSLDEDWLHTLRLILEDIYNKLFETLKNKLNKPIDLWFSHTITDPSIVHLLASLKGKDFYFNDITLLTRVHPGKVNLKNSPSSSSKTEVRYHMKFNSRYGLVDLAAFHRSFRKQYIVFPEVDFSVKDTQFVNGKDILIMELEEQPKSKKEWNEIREVEQTVLSEHKKNVKSERAKCIQKAAFEASLRFPMKRLTNMKIKLKHFILKIDHRARDVPTYDMLAKVIDTSNTNQIPENYKAYSVPFNYFIEQVLYKRKCYNLPTLESATEIIKTKFGGNYMQEDDVKPLWKKYLETVETHELTFVDYSCQHPLTQTLVNNDATLLDRKEISLLKLAIWQCDGEWIRNQITLYSFDSIQSAALSALKRLNIGETMEINIKKKFYLTAEDAWENRLQRNSSSKNVMYQIDVHDDTVILNLTHLLQIPKASYHLPTNTFVKKHKMFKKNIENNHNVNAIRLSPKQELKETLLVSLVKNLNFIFSKYNEECYISSILNKRSVLL